MTHRNETLRRTVTAATALLFFLPSCDGATHDHGDMAMSHDMSASCAAETRADPFAPGFVKAGADGVLKVKIVSADPALPTKGDNTWILQVLDAGGMPLDGATITATPFMPDHGHGTGTKPTVTDQPTDHAYKVAPLNLFMPGLWEVRFALEAGAGKSDNAVIKVCIEG